MPKYLDGIRERADGEQAREAKKKKSMPGFDDDQRGSSRVPGVSRSFDQRRQVSCCRLGGCGGSSCCGGGGGFPKTPSQVDRIAAGKSQLSLRKSSTIGSGYRFPGLEPRTVVDTELGETHTTVGKRMLKEGEEAPIAEAAAKINPSHVAVSLAQTAETFPHEPEAAAKVDPSHVAASLAQTAEAFPDDPIFRLEGLLDCFGSLFSGVSFQWDEIFKEPVWSKLFHDVIDHRSISYS